MVLLAYLYYGPKQEKIEKIIENGVEVVINHLEPYQIKGELSSLVLEEELSIDFASDEIGELGIADATNFEVASDGTIYFTYSHKSDDLIFQFDQNGKFETSFGRKGQGFEEIQFIRIQGLIRKTT